jgi:glycine oxidase
MESPPDVLVIGGGVIGLTAAYFLARDKLHVEVVDRGDFGQEASWAGAGILPPGNQEKAITPLDQLRAHSTALFPVLSAELRELTGVDNGYLASGGLIRSADETIADLWRAEGITYEPVRAEALRRLEPALAPVVDQAFFLPGMAQLRNPRHVKALVAACQMLGVRLRPGCPVTAFERHGSRIVAVKTGAGSLAANRFLLTTGAWTDPLLEHVGWRPGIHPIRGQIVLLRTGAPVLRRIVMQEKRYLVPRPDGRVLVGSTEEDAGFDKGTTAEAVGHLLTFAVGLVPALAHAAVERCWAGLRPGTPDGLPFLGAVPGVDNLFVAAGHFRAGIQLSAATGMVIRDLVLEREPAVALEPFRLDRSPSPAVRSAFRS